MTAGIYGVRERRVALSVPALASPWVQAGPQFHLEAEADTAASCHWETLQSSLLTVLRDSWTPNPKSACPALCFSRTSTSPDHCLCTRTFCSPPGSYPCVVSEVDPHSYPWLSSLISIIRQDLKVTDGILNWYMLYHSYVVCEEF